MHKTSIPCRKIIHFLAHLLLKMRKKAFGWQLLNNSICPANKTKRENLQESLFVKMKLHDQHDRELNFELFPAFGMF